MASNWLAGADELWDATKGMARGVDLVADALKPTLGPKGEMVTVKTAYGGSYLTKRGALIAEGIKAYDPYEAVGVRMITEAATDTNRLTGDGASTTTVLAQFLLNESLRLIAAGANPIELQRGIDLAKKTVLRALKRQAQRVTTPEHLAQIGAISSDGSPDVARIIGDTVKYGVPMGVITVEGVVDRKERVQIYPSPSGYRIVVPGRTRAEAEQHKFRVNSAVRTAQSAMEEGIVPGGGAALLYASRALEGITLADGDQQAGVDIVRRALEAPIRQLVENAGVNGTSVAEKLLHEPNVYVGYNVDDGNYVDMYRAGVVDSAKVVRAAFEGATSVASALVAYPSILKADRVFIPGQSKNPYFGSFKRAVAEAAGGVMSAGGGRLSPPPPTSGRTRGGDAPQPETRVQPPRYLVGRFPSRIAIGDTATLSVKISVNPFHGRAERIRDLTVPKQGLLLDIAVQADGFEFLTPQNAPIRLPPTGDSTGAAFDLKALAERKTFIRISAFHGGTCIGGLQIPVKVETPGTVPTSPEDVAGQPIGGLISRPGDVALLVAFNDKSQAYSFTWQDKNGAQTPVDLQKSLAEIDVVISGIVTEIQEIVRMDFTTQTKVAENSLRQRGIKIWKDLIPTPIQSQFIANCTTIKRMMIVSDGDPIPWEMLYPYVVNPRFDHGFLVDQVELSRWKFGSLPPGAIALRRADFVMPNVDLEMARREVNQVSKLLTGWNASIRSHAINKAEELLELLDQAIVSLLHFACHNAYDNTGGRIIVKSPVTPGDYLSLHDRLKEIAPFAFMNACRTDGTPPEYIRIGKKEGWAQCFLDMGFGAFIGTLWEVRDDSAAEFAAAVYTELVKNKSFGDALKHARKTLRSEFPGDPTWLAYSFYGASGARVQKVAVAPTH